jgi:hypothetical protein
MQGANCDHLRQGMAVIGREGGRIGEVKEVRSNDFLVDRPMDRDVYVPFSAFHVSEGRVRLDVNADEVNDQDWQTSDILTTEEKGDQHRRGQ